MITRPTIITKHIPIRVGDVEAGLCRNPIWWSRKPIRRKPIEHAYLEPEAGLAYVDHDDVVTIVSPSQNITHHRHMLARIIAKPISKVRFIMSPVGGGFGGKEDMIYQGMLALLAMKTRRRCGWCSRREESIVSTAKRHPSRTTLRMGLDARWPHPRLAPDAWSATAAPMGSRPRASCARRQSSAPGPYAIPNVRVDTYGIYTNNTPSGAFRSFGALQTQFATEAISTSAPNGSASIRSRSGASTPCATAP